MLGDVEDRRQEDDHRVADPHRLSSVSDGFAQCGDWNHSGPVIPIFDSSVLTGPVPGLNRNTKPSVAATGGASVGR